jgi:hypothetical protein
VPEQPAASLASCFERLRRTVKREKQFAFFLLHLKHLQHLVAVVVDDLDGDLAGLGFVEGTAGGAVETGPCSFIDLGA